MLESQEIVRFLEELEEQNMVRSYMTRLQSACSPQEMGLLSSEAAQRELEAMLLAQSPIFRRLVEAGLSEIKQGKTRPVEELLNELRD